MKSAIGAGPATGQIIIGRRYLLSHGTSNHIHKIPHTLDIVYRCMTTKRAGQGFNRRDAENIIPLETYRFMNILAKWVSFQLYT
jgi:hypothetical protein